jgi:hypothetical protein
MTLVQSLYLVIPFIPSLVFGCAVAREISPGYRQIAEKEDREECAQATKQNTQREDAARAALYKNIQVKDPDGFALAGRSDSQAIVGVRLQYINNFTKAYYGFPKDTWSCAEHDKNVEEGLREKYYVAFENSGLYITSVPESFSGTLDELLARREPLVVTIQGRQVRFVNRANRSVNDERLVATPLHSDCGQLTYSLTNVTKSYIRVRTVSVHAVGSIESVPFEPPLTLPPAAVSEQRLKLNYKHRPVVCPEVRANTRDSSVVLGMSVEYTADERPYTLAGDQSFAVKDFL